MLSDVSASASPSAGPEYRGAREGPQLALEMQREAAAGGTGGGGLVGTVSGGSSRSP